VPIGGKTTFKAEKQILFHPYALRSLSCVATSVLRMRLLHVVALSKKLRWLA